MGTFSSFPDEAMKYKQVIPSTAMDSLVDN